MGWFKKKRDCAHCNQNKAKRDFENRPTCGECLKKILLKRESPRSCPVDGTTLVKEHRQDIIIDRCPTCKGVWLDAGELETLQEAAQEEGMAIGMVVF